MCGIIGYIGEKEATPVLINGLKKLEYRGYDSCGLSLIENNKINSKKVIGKVEVLEKAANHSKSKIGIAHTRWATHGKVTEANAHPHYDCNKSISIVHNGIIENHQELKHILNHHTFKSNTDTEVIAHLIEEFLQKDKTIEEAFTETLNLLEGAYSIAMIHKENPDKIFVARKSSPLVLGIGENETLVASDVVPILKYTNNIIYLQDGDIAILEQRDYKIKNIENITVDREIIKLKMNISEISKGEFPHFMLKEIYEQSNSVKNAFKGRIDYENATSKFGGLNISKKDIENIDKIILVGCGTSWHAGLIGKQLFEDIAKIPSTTEYASEFRYRNPVLNKNNLVIALSQSGETADTIAALKEAKKYNIKTIGLVNTVGSTISKLVDGGIYLHSGQEIGVASTKTFTSHLTILYLLAIYIGRIKKTISRKQAINLMKDLEKLPKLIEETYRENNHIRKIATKYFNNSNALYLGRNYNFPIALEGALKLKEISYIHAEGYPAAEMKHGPIALIDQNMPTIVIAPSGRLYQKILSNIEEVKSRNGKIIAITTKENNQLEKLVDETIFIPKTSEYLTPILTSIPTQLLAYHIAVLRGCDIDKPRNLAKCVTVE
jgi:glucosamine--fructose-6-phosphate aminotransferase (isomerizing)